MNLRFSILALLFTAIACEPIGTQDDALDPDALFDQKPVRSEGWEVEGQSSARYDGLNLSTTPTSQSDGLSQQELSINNVRMTKKIVALSGQESGTLRLQFNLPKIAQSGLRFELSFLTGLGLASEVRLTQTGLTAKCGSLNLNDGLASASASKVLEARVDYEIRILREASKMSVLLDDEVLIKDLACTGLQNVTDDPRSFGSVSMVLYSQVPSEPLTWTAADMLLHESQFLVKRITVYKDLVIE
ncbi:MAG: hypothetical protein R3A80_02515 [Bdellovibrionota bacterium]